MNPEEYDKLRRVEQNHWFYRGKRHIVRYWIDRFIDLDREDLLIDAGMGTGQWLVEMASRSRILGIDDHAESLVLAGPRVEAAGGRVLECSLTAVSLPSGVATVVTMMDVLEHIDDDAGAFTEMLRLTRPGGLLVITVPALPWLWSDWDEVLHHRRRYTKRDLLRVVQVPEVQVLRCAYFNTALLLPIALVRSCRRIRGVRGRSDRLEDRVPIAPINWALYHLMVGPACLSFCPAPSGVSLLAVLRRS